MLKYLHTTFFNRQFPVATREVLYCANDIEVSRDGHFLTKNLPCHCCMCMKNRQIIDNLDVNIKDYITNRKVTEKVLGNGGRCTVCHDRVEVLMSCEWCNESQCARCAYYGHIHSNPKCETKFKEECGVSNFNLTPLQFLMRNISTKCPDMTLMEWYNCPKIEL